MDDLVVVAGPWDYEPGYMPSFDWCRFRERRHCIYPHHLDEHATETQGEPVWVRVDRGLCTRDKWEDQEVCQISEPGPNAGKYGAKQDDPEPEEDDESDDEHQSPFDDQIPDEVWERYLRWINGGARSPGLLNEEEGHHTWFHGTGTLFKRFRDPTRFYERTRQKDMELSDQTGDSTPHRRQPTWNARLGTHFTGYRPVAEGIAQAYEGSEDEETGEERQGHVVHARLTVRNPKRYESQDHLDQDALGWAFKHGHGPQDPPAHLDPRSVGVSHIKHINQLMTSGEPLPHPSENRIARRKWLTLHPHAAEIAEGFRAHLKAQGHDGIVYGSEETRSYAPAAIWDDNERTHPEFTKAAIAFHPNQIQIQSHHGAYDDEHEVPVLHENGQQVPRRQFVHPREVADAPR